MDKMIKDKNFMSEDIRALIEEKMEYLRTYLGITLRNLREGAEMTQAHLAELMCVQQAAVSKMESTLCNHDLESIVKYLHFMESELVVVIRKRGEIYQITDNEDMVVMVPKGALPQAAGLSQEQVVEELPGLEIEDVKAALLYAKQLVGGKVFFD